MSTPATDDDLTDEEKAELDRRADDIFERGEGISFEEYRERRSEE